MKVRCVRLVDERGYSWNGTLTLGKVYVVHTLSADHHGVAIRVLTDLGNYAMGMYSMDQFEVVDRSISPSWAIASDERGRVEIAPAPWVTTLLEVGHIEDGIEGVSALEIRAEIDRAEAP